MAVLNTSAVPHQYFVDGSPMIADVQLTTSGTETWENSVDWRT